MSAAEAPKGVELQHEEFGTVIEVPSDQADTFKAAGYTPKRSAAKTPEK